MSITSTGFLTGPTSLPQSLPKTITEIYIELFGKDPDIKRQIELTKRLYSRETGLSEHGLSRAIEQAYNRADTPRTNFLETLHRRVFGSLEWFGDIHPTEMAYFFYMEMRDNDLTPPAASTAKKTLSFGNLDITRMIGTIGLKDTVKYLFAIFGDMSRLDVDLQELSGEPIKVNIRSY